MTKCMGAPSWKEMKMLRVSKRAERSRTVLIVEGRLNGGPGCSLLLRLVPAGFLSGLDFRFLGLRAIRHYGSTP